MPCYLHCTTISKLPGLRVQPTLTKHSDCVSIYNLNIFNEEASHQLVILLNNSSIEEQLLGARALKQTYPSL
jgi:hypothetical protein